MDIERMKKLLTSGIEAGNKVKAVREVVKTYKTQKQDIYDDTAEVFKPSIDVQKEVLDVQKGVKETIDEKQSKIIEELKNNQEKLVKAIEYKPTNAITYDPERSTTSDGKMLPYLKRVYYESGDDESGDDEGGDDEEVKPSTSENKPPIINLDNGITDAYKQFLEEKGLPLPSEIFKTGLDTDEFIKKVNAKIKRNEEYIKSHSTKKGEPLKNLKKIQKSTYERHKVETPYLKEIKSYQSNPKICG